MLADYQGIVPALSFDTPGVAIWTDTRIGSRDLFIVRVSRTRGTTCETWRRLRFSTNDLVNLIISGEEIDRICFFARASTRRYAGGENWFLASPSMVRPYQTAGAASTGNLFRNLFRISAGLGTATWAVSRVRSPKRGNWSVGRGSLAAERGASGHLEAGPVYWRGYLRLAGFNR